MKKASTYNSDAKELNRHFRENVSPKMIELAEFFMMDHGSQANSEDIDDLGNALMRAGLKIKSIIKTNPVNHKL